MNKNQKLLAFISLVIACFLTILDGTIVNVSLPTMAEQFNTDIAGVSWVATVYLIPFSALLITFSKIADMYGRKKLFIIGLITFGASSVLCGFSTSLQILIVFRIIQGIGAAILTPLSIPLGIELFGKNAMAKLAIAIGMIIAIAAASGPVVGGLLNETFGFRSIFFVNIPFLIIALIFGVKYVKECYDTTIEKKIDFVGAILLTYGIGALTFFLVKGNDYGWDSFLIISLIISSVLSIIIFIIYERRISNPMMEFNLLKKRSFTTSILLISIVFFGFMPSSYLMNFYMENTLGYSVIKSGLIIGVISLTSFFLAPIFGFISKKTSSKVTSFISMICISAGNLAFAFINSSNHITIIYAAFILIGIGIGAVTPLYQSALIEIESDKNGIASGILNSLRQLTVCIAIALVTTLSTHYTAISIDNTKTSIINDIKENSVLDTQIKDTLVDKIQTSTSKDSNGFSKDMVGKLIDEEEVQLLQKAPLVIQPKIKENFIVQKDEIFKIVDDFTKIKEDESYKVYNKCFLIFGLLTALGIFLAPFNSPKKKREKGTENEMAFVN